MRTSQQNPTEYKKQEEEKKAKQQQMKQLNTNEAIKLRQQEYEKRKKERLQKLNNQIEETKEAQESKKAFEDQEQKIECIKKEIKKELTQQSESLQKRLAERKKRLALKRSVTNSQYDQEESQQDRISPLNRRGLTINENRPMTVKGNKQISKRFMGNFDDVEDLNEISIIKDTNGDTTQLEEASFSLDLLRKLQDEDNMNHRRAALIDTTFDNEDELQQQQYDYGNESLDQDRESQQQQYEQSMKDIWSSCEQMMEELQREMQIAIEKIIEEVTQQKFEKIAEVKADYEFIIKRLDQQKNKEKSDLKKQERDQDVKKVIEEMELLKKQKIDQVKLDFEDKKRQKQQEKDKHIQEQTIKIKQSMSREVSRMHSMIQTPTNIFLNKVKSSQKKPNDVNYDGDLTNVYAKVPLQTTKQAKQKQFIFTENMINEATTLRQKPIKKEETALSKDNEDQKTLDTVEIQNPIQIQKTNNLNAVKANKKRFEIKLDNESDEGNQLQSENIIIN